MTFTFRYKLSSWLRSWLPRVLTAKLSPAMWLESLGKGVLKCGPFAGLRYPSASAGSSLLPKYAGCYETEIQNWITMVLAGQYQQQIHVGAAEGFYVCGFASRLPQCQFIAYEMDAKARVLLHENVVMNDLEDRINLQGECTVETLKADLCSAPDTLVFMDAEGAEALLLDPCSIPDLARADIIVEVHEFIIPGIGNTLAERFQESHDIQEITSKERSWDDLPVKPSLFLKSFRSGTLLHLLGEGRPGPMSWLWMRRRWQPEISGKSLKPSHS